MITLMILYILALVAYILYARRSVNAAIPTPARQQLENEHVARLRQERLVDDFVLTAAAVPALDNKIAPEEGYRVYHNDGYFKMFGGCVILVSVSAEKLKHVFLEMVRRVGDVVSISVADFFSDEHNVVDYISFNRDIYVVENIIDRYWLMLQNNYDVQVSIFAGEKKVELFLTRAKFLSIHTVEPQAFFAVLHEFGIAEKPALRYFTEEPHYVFNDYAGTDVVHRLTADMDVHEKRFYEKEAVAR